MVRNIRNTTELHHATTMIPHLAINFDFTILEIPPQSGRGFRRLYKNTYQLGQHWPNITFKHPLFLHEHMPRTLRIMFWVCGTKRNRRLYTSGVAFLEHQKGRGKGLSRSRMCRVISQEKKSTICRKKSTCQWIRWLAKIRYARCVFLSI